MRPWVSRGSTFSAPKPPDRVKPAQPTNFNGVPMREPGRGKTYRSYSSYLFGVFMTALIPLLDAVMANDIARQADSARFAAVAGTITHSEVFQYRSNDGDVFTGADIRYRYAVNGRSFEGDTLRYSTAAFHSSERGWAERAVRKYPVGASVTVYYDPHDPAQSLLQPGFGGTELYLIMFMMVFNAAMVASWVFGGTALWRRWRGLPPQLPPVLRRADATRLRFAPHAGSLGALAGISGASFVGIMVQPLDASLADMQTAWALVLGAGAVLGALRWLERKSGAFDLIIREATVTLPDRFFRWRRPTLNRSTIAGVNVKPGWFFFMPAQVRIACTNGRTEILTAWHDADAAAALARQVAEQLDL